MWRMTGCMTQEVCPVPVVRWRTAAACCICKCPVTNQDATRSAPQAQAFPRYAMPIYEYQCPGCGHVFEEWVKASESLAEEPCPRCGTAAPRVMSQTSFVLKGGGWYVSDYGYRKGIKEDGSSDGGTSSGGQASAPAADAKTDASSGASQSAGSTGSGQSASTAAPSSTTSATASANNTGAQASKA